jgi:EAL and modified HD-GYP domain-containing signal transduction protein
MPAQPSPVTFSDDEPQKMAPCSPQEQAVEVRYVARQPILDRRGKVHGYELLLWNGRESAFGAESELAARALLGNAIVFGVEQLTSGQTAFVQCTADSLSEDWVRRLPPKLTVLELQEDVDPSPKLIADCRKLKVLGFRLALNDFTGKLWSRPLLELADYVKVDIAKAGAAERRSLPGRLEGFSARPIAKNVETQKDYKQVCGEGFDLFQGYYFCRPEPVKNHKIPANRMVQIEIMEFLQKDPVDLHRLSQLVMCDASLTYGLLRLVNSPVCAMRQEVTSIQSALVLLGQETFRRIVMLAIAGDFNNGQPTELLRMAFERGRLCELCAELLGLVPTEQYLIGMVSMFSPMLRIPMEDLVQLLPLREGASDALLGKGNREGVLLAWLVCLDRGDWAACKAILESNGLRFNQVMWRYAEAVAWAQAALKATI